MESRWVLFGIKLECDIIKIKRWVRNMANRLTKSQKRAKKVKKKKLQESNSTIKFTRILSDYEVGNLSKSERKKYLVYLQREVEQLEQELNDMGGVSEEEMKMFYQEMIDDIHYYDGDDEHKFTLEEDGAHYHLLSQMKEEDMSSAMLRRWEKIK